MKRLSNIEKLSSEAANNVGNQTLRKQSNSGGKQGETIFEKITHQNHAWWKDHFSITFVELFIQKKSVPTFSGSVWDFLKENHISQACLVAPVSGKQSNYYASPWKRQSVWISGQSNFFIWSETFVLGFEVRVFEGSVYVICKIRHTKKRLREWNKRCSCRYWGGWVYSRSFQNSFTDFAFSFSQFEKYIF